MGQKGDLEKEGILSSPETCQDMPKHLQFFGPGKQLATIDLSSSHDRDCDQISLIGNSR